MQDTTSEPRRFQHCTFFPHFNIILQPQLCSVTQYINAGWDPHSYGYHGDDGHSFGGNSTGACYGPSFTTGDTIGVLFSRADKTVAFYKNGLDLGVAFRNVPETRLFPTVGFQTRCAASRRCCFSLHAVLVNDIQVCISPAIQSLGLQHPGWPATSAALCEQVPFITHPNRRDEEVDANFGSKPFVSDFAAMQAEQRSSVADAVAATALPAPRQPGSDLLAQVRPRCHDVVSPLRAIFCASHNEA